jgi:uncharacterized membrane protein YeaQ/YmgE (transglycosylase-associated protein family)
MSFNAESLIAVLTVGLLAGLVAGQFTKSQGVAFIGNVATGIAGAFIGYTALGLAGLNPTDSLLATVINAAFGALVFVIILVAIANSRIGSIVSTEFVQEIHALTVTPAPGGMTVSFTTKLPSVPTFELYRNIKNIESEDMVPENHVVTWGMASSPSRTHLRRIDGLPHGTLFWFRLTAGVDGIAILGGQPRSATFVGKAGTLFRFCLIGIDSLQVLSVGNSENGEMDFEFQVYDGSNANTSVPGVSHPGDPLMTQQDWEFDDVNNGDKFGPLGSNVQGPNIQITNTPDIIVAYLLGVHQISGLFGTMTPPTLPDKTSHGTDDAGQWSDAFFAIPLPATGGNSARRLLSSEPG